MRADPTDVDARWDCASLYAELNEFPKAIDCLEQLLALRPGDVEICKMVAKVRLPLAFRLNFSPVSLCTASSMSFDLIYLVYFVLGMNIPHLSCKEAWGHHGQFSYLLHALYFLTSSLPEDEKLGLTCQMRQKNGQSEQATQLLEHLIETYPYEADLSAVNLLAELHMANGAFAITISWIDRARELYSADQPLPLDLSVKAGICHAYLGDLESAEVDG